VELVNGTPLAAECFASEIEEGDPRIGLLVAKATFRFDGDGRVALDRDEPHPIYREDEETELGPLPGDLVVRDDEGFEVIVLGEAVAPDGRPVENMYVTLAVGDRVGHLLVTGNRWWQIELDADGAVVPERCVPTAPHPFERMPLGWDRAFGGRAEVLIDHESPLEVSHRLNPEGRGFDPEPAARELGRALEAPEGFPVVERVRALPNVEDPSQPVTRWDDDPEPVGWGALPVSSAIRAMRAFAPGEEVEIPPPPMMPPEMLHRAHPDWVLPLPEAGARIFLRGMVPGYPEVSLALPRMRVLADYVAGQREGTAELRPHLLALLPGEQRFYILFRLLFNYPFDPMAERCIRLRTDEGWFGAS